MTHNMAIACAYCCACCRGKTPRLVHVTDVCKIRAYMVAGNVTRFARVDFRNDERVFGIKDEDRLLHLYSSARPARENRRSWRTWRSKT